MSRKTSCVLLLSLLGLGVPGHAGSGPYQDWQALAAQARRSVAEMAAQAYPQARATVTMGEVDARLRLVRCDEVHFFQPAGEQLIGKGSLGVRCAAPQAWTLYLGYQLALHGPALVARHPLALRQPIRPTDVELREIAYDRPPGEYLDDSALPEGAVAARPVAVGQALTHDMLVRRDAVQAGRKVRLLVRGAGFQVSREGVAMNNAKPGDTVRVRLPGGRIIEGRTDADGQVIVEP